jgi:signal transduction histidine kinase
VIIRGSLNDNAQYLSKTIDDFRNFIKGERVEKLFNLSEEIDSFLHLMEGSIKSNYMQVSLDLNNDINILGYPNELMQCFINIFNNSKDVLKELPEGNRLVFIKTDIADKKVIITLRDNGGGIPDEVLSKVFEPYFTTKDQSLGTGLGLNMSYKLIVEGMQGSLEATNINFEYKDKKYKGAEFKITLPLYE